MAVPALGALAADPLVSLADTAFVGRLGVMRAADRLRVWGLGIGIIAAQMVASALPACTVLLVVVPMGWGSRASGGRRRARSPSCISGS